MTIDVFLDTSSSSLHKAGAFKRAYHYSAGDERPFFGITTQPSVNKTIQKRKFQNTQTQQYVRAITQVK
ncbi:hypothetical protein ACP3BZ_003777, partial [Klebsiella pneumoniae]